MNFFAPNRYKISLTLLISITLTACGGSSDSSSSNATNSSDTDSSTDSNSFTVTAIDGYLSSAEVYVDRDGDGIADSDELVGSTDSNGQIILDSENEVYPIIIRAVAGITRDSDYSGTIAENYEMVSTAGSPVVTPFTTMAYLKDMTMEELVTELDPNGTLGLTAGDISGDYALTSNDVDVTVQALARSIAGVLTEEVSDNAETTLDTYVESIVETVETQVLASSDVASDLGTMVITVESNNGVVTPTTTTTTALESANDSNSEEEEENNNSGGGVIVINPSEDDDEEDDTPVDDEVVEEEETETETETPLEEEEEEVVEEETEVTACYNDNEGATLVSKTVSSADYAENLAKFDMPDGTDLTITGIRPYISAHYSIVGITNVDTGERYQGLELRDNCYYDIAVTEGTNLQFEILELTDSEKAEKGVYLNDSYSGYQGIHTIASTNSGFELHDLPLGINLITTTDTGNYLEMDYHLPPVLFDKSVTSGMLLENYNIRTENGNFHTSQAAEVRVKANSLATNQFGTVYAVDESYLDLSNIGNDTLIDGVETTIYTNEYVTPGYISTVKFIQSDIESLNEYNTRIELTIGDVGYDIEHKQGINIADEDRAEISVTVDYDGNTIGFSLLNTGIEIYLLQFAG